MAVVYEVDLDVEGGVWILRLHKEVDNDEPNKLAFIVRLLFIEPFKMITSRGDTKKVIPQPINPKDQGGVASRELELFDGLLKQTMARMEKEIERANRRGIKK